MPTAPGNSPAPLILLTTYPTSNDLSHLYEVATVTTILIILLILILIGALPTWPHSRGWGYGPTGIVGILLIVLLVLMLAGRV